MLRVDIHQTAAPGTPRCRAAPAGGAPKGGWGCLWWIMFTLFSTQTVAQDAAMLDVPSNQPIKVLEYLSDMDAIGTVLRARYLAPTLTGSDDIDAVLDDMAVLCESDAISIRETMDPAPTRIIVSLSSEPVDFGASVSDVTQYFEAYRVEDGRCIWELF